MTRNREIDINIVNELFQAKIKEANRYNLLDFLKYVGKIQ